MVHFIPANLNVDELLKSKPPKSINNFNKDFLIYFLHLINAIPATNKELEIYDGFVPIYSPILQRKAKNYREYIDYLIDAGIVLSDNHYLPTVKSKGYKFAPNYKQSKLRRVTITDAKLRKAIKAESVFANTIKKKYNHLIKWYSEGLEIDKELAIDFIDTDLNRKLDDETLLDFDNKTKKPKNPYLQYNSAYINIQRIADADFKLSIDDNVFRLHSTISNLRSEIRNCLKYRGQNLVSIDIKNSQPYLSTVLLNERFWQGYNYQQIIRIEDISKGLLDRIFTKGSSELFPFIMLSKSAQAQSQQDIQRFTTLVQQGIFYEYLATEIGICYTSIIAIERKLKWQFFRCCLQTIVSLLKKMQHLKNALNNYFLQSMKCSQASKNTIRPICLSYYSA